MNINEMNHAVRKALESLGWTADDVASVLNEEGCKGIRNKPASCPVSIYLTRRLPGYQAEFNGFFVAIARSGTTAAVTAVVPHRSVNIFARRFDTGHYPTLEKRT